MRSVLLKYSALFIALSVAASWLLIALLRTLSVGGTWRPLSSGTSIFVIVAFLCLLAGCLAGQKLLPPPARENRDNESFSELVILFLALVSLLGASMVIFEFAVVRGYGLALPVTVIRDLEVERATTGVSPSGFSGAGRLMSAAIVSAWVTYFIVDRRFGRLALSLLLLSSAVGLFVEVRFLGGRLMMSILAVACVVAFLSASVRRRHISMARLLALLVMLGVTGGYFLNVFVERINHRGPDAEGVYQRYGQSLDLLGDGEGSLWLEPPTEESSVPPVLRFAWIYATHGMSYLDRLVTKPPMENAHGLRQFAQVGQILSVATRQNFSFDDVSAGIVPGVYTTLLGDSIVDFGYVGTLVVAAILGFLLTASVGQALTGVGPFACTFPLLATIALFSPMVSLVHNTWPAIFWLLVAWPAARFASVASRRLKSKLA